MSQTALLALQPEREGNHDSYERALCQGWSGKSQYPNMHLHVAGSVQPSWERWDSHGHVFDSLVFQGYWARMCQERSKKSNASCDNKASHSKKKGTKWPGTEATTKVLRKLVPRNNATFARSMGARTRRTILVIAVGSRKMKWKNLMSMPLGKAERNPIPFSSCLCSWARNWKNSRRWSRKKTPRNENIAPVIVIPTGNWVG